MKQTVEEANKLDEVLKFIYDTKVRQTTLDRHDIETVHLPSLIHKINELRAASLPTNSMQWVRADKRLPEMDAEYFVFIDDYKSVAIFIDGAFWSDDIKVDVKRWLDESAPTEPTPDNESKSADWRKNNL